VASVARADDVSLIVNNMVATPYLCHPIEWGADLAAGRWPA
jgi:O-acetylhomoserine/O-acetylserine sulfhydrylase-like pyridoxal-dependent enzyme